MAVDEPVEAVMPAMAEEVPSLHTEYKDFDDAVIESGVIVVKLKGREWMLPSEVSASLVLQQLRASGSKGTIEMASIPEWLEALVGKGRLTEMLDAEVSWKQLNELTQWLLVKYGVVPEGAFDRIKREQEKAEGSTPDELDGDSTPN